MDFFVIICGEVLPELALTWLGYDSWLKRVNNERFIQRGDDEEPLEAEAPAASSQKGSFTGGKFNFRLQFLLFSCGCFDTFFL